MNSVRVELDTPAGPAWADIDRPRGALLGLFVLTHGAGGGVDTADLRAVMAATVPLGMAAVRLTQPFRVAGRRSPPTPMVQDAAWLAAVAALRRRRGFARPPLVVGGRSNGARVACRTALASGACGVVALAYPLHPPGRPEISRLAELDGAGVPVLVVQGARDPFGMPPPGDGREIVVLDGADHALRRGSAELAQAVTTFVTSTVAHARVGR